MNDYSEYLKKPGILAWIEQEWKAKPGMHEDHADIVNDALVRYKLSTVIEVGYGTGELARRLNAERYYGYDSNDECQEIARRKISNNGYLFFTKDVRDIKREYSSDVVIAFGFLKHFGLHEWQTIFQKVASLGKYFIFDIPIAAEVKDDGVDYHHVWMSMERIKEEIELAGLKLVEVFNPESVEPVFVCKAKTSDLAKGLSKKSTGNLDKVISKDTNSYLFFPGETKGKLKDLE